MTMQIDLTKLESSRNPGVTQPSLALEIGDTIAEDFFQFVIQDLGPVCKSSCAPRSVQCIWLFLKVAPRAVLLADPIMENRAARLFVKSTIALHLNRDRIWAPDTEKQPKTMSRTGPGPLNSRKTKCPYCGKGPLNVSSSGWHRVCRRCLRIVKVEDQNPVRPGPRSRRSGNKVDHQRI